MLTAAAALALLASLAGCDKEKMKKRAKKVYRDYYAAVLETVAKKGKVDHDELKDRAAARNGFRDWTDFVATGEKLLGEEAMKVVAREMEAWYEDALHQLVVKMMQEGEGEAGEDDNGGGEDSELPPVFKAGTKLADTERKEVYEIKEVRGEWFRGDHYKIRGDATDLMAKDAWVYAPGKGWDWVTYEPKKK
jgi:hypothetical protein